MLLYWTAALLVLCDQAAKHIVLVAFEPGDSVPILKGFFHLTSVRNTGIAFGLFQQYPLLLTGLIFVCVLALSAYSLRMIRRSNLEQFAYGLILGGAVGNMIDRMRFGWVVDFLDFRVWPVFNLADSGITIGVLLIALRILFAGEARRAV